MMATLSQSLNTLRGQSGKIAPPRTLTLPASIFASDWGARPKDSIAVGLRSLSEGDLQTSTSEATKFALGVHPEGGEAFVDAYNDALIRWALARGLCDPNDVHGPCPVLPLPDEEAVRCAFTKAGARWIFDELERLQIETSPIYPEADEDDIRALGDFLSRDEPLWPLEGLRERRARRLLRFVLEEIQAAHETEG